jgi:hypothetical protein
MAIASARAETSSFSERVPKLVDQFGCALSERCRIGPHESDEQFLHELVQNSAAQRAGAGDDDWLVRGMSTSWTQAAGGAVANARRRPVDARGIRGPCGSAEAAGGVDVAGLDQDRQANRRSVARRSARIFSRPKQGDIRPDGRVAALAAFRAAEAVKRRS